MTLVHLINNLVFIASYSIYMKHIPIACFCTALIVLIFGSLNWQALYDIVTFRKSAVVFAAILFTVIATAIELIILARHSPLSSEDFASAVAKVFAALALVATVLSSAEDLSGKNDKVSPVLNGNPR